MAKKKKEEKIELLDLSGIDLTKPLPQPGGSVKEINCLHKLEYLTGPERIAFMEEAYRVLEPGGKLNVVVCYWSSPRSIQDQLLRFPPLCEQSFLYFNKGWREANKRPSIKCDFDFGYGYQVDPDTAARNQETQAFWIKHYLNTAGDLQVAMTKRAPEGTS
jgi:hypothetical protein